MAPPKKLTGHRVSLYIGDAHFAALHAAQAHHAQTAGDVPTISALVASLIDAHGEALASPALSMPFLERERLHYEDLESVACLVASSSRRSGSEGAIRTRLLRGYALSVKHHIALVTEHRTALLARTDLPAHFAPVEHDILLGHYRQLQAMLDNMERKS